MRFVSFFTRDGGGGAHMDPGWPPVAWGRGCLLIGNSDKPLPEGEEGVVEEERGISLDRLSPKGLAGFCISCARFVPIRLFSVLQNVAPAAALAPFPRLQLFQIVFPRQHWRVRSFQVALPLQRWPRSRASVLPNRAPAAALVSLPFSVLASFPRFCPSKSCSRCSAGLISVGPGLIPALRSFQIVLPCNAMLCCVPLCDAMPCAAML